MANVTGTGSKAQGKGKAPDPTDLPRATRMLLEQQFRQNQVLFKTQQPVRKLLARQTLEALRTGGVGARIPIIQRAVESANLAGSQALRRTEEGLGSMAGTPFGQSILAQTRQQNRFASSQIPTTFAASLINAAGGGGGPVPQFGSAPSGAGGGAGGGVDLSGIGSFLGNLAGSKNNKKTGGGGA